MMKHFTILFAVWLSFVVDTQPARPVRFAIVGLVHDHARGFIPVASSRQDIQLVGIAEPNQQLAERYARTYKLDTNLFYTSLEAMLDKANVQAVAIFTSTFDHRRVVETCAARGIHVMMEKPLAVNMEHARAIEAAARKGGVQIVVNFETTWYAANHSAYSLIHEKNASVVCGKIVVHDGHSGPKEIGCSADFRRG
jgi:predicted dehydrogenase